MHRKKKLRKKNDIKRKRMMRRKKRRMKRNRRTKMQIAHHFGNTWIRSILQPVIPFSPLQRRQTRKDITKKRIKREARTK